MVDRANVIFDLERCICHVPDACRDCSKYNADGIPTLTCMESLISDALELLKEQESVRPVKQIEQAEWTVCGHCHKHIISKWVFCPYCGRAVKWDAD